VANERTEKISVVACAVKHVTSTRESPTGVDGAIPLNVTNDIGVSVWGLVES
jgi:hypothetical protein